MSPVVTFLFGVVYDAVAEADGVAALDHPLLEWAIAHRTPTLDTVITVYTDIGGPVVMPILATAVAVLLSVLRRSWTPFLVMLLGGGGALLMTIAGKRIFGRVRPSHADAVPPFETSPSFPSGHSLNAFVLAGLVAYLLILRQHRALARVATITVAAVFALTIGLSRVFLGHHWFTDVLAAWAIGAAWLAFVITAHRLYVTVQRRRADAHPTPVQTAAPTVGG